MRKKTSSLSLSNILFHWSFELNGLFYFKCQRSLIFIFSWESLVSREFCWEKVFFCLLISIFSANCCWVGMLYACYFWTHRPQHAMGPFCQICETFSSLYITSLLYQTVTAPTFKKIYWKLYLCVAPKNR